MQALRDNPGDKSMTDRVFTETKELKDLGVELIIPNFKGHDRSHMTKEAEG